MKHGGKRAGAVLLAAVTAMSMGGYSGAVFGAQENNVILSEDFEGSSYEFTSRGDTVIMNISDQQNHTEGLESGSGHSAYVTGRTDSWNGISKVLTGLVEEGNTYTFTAWVRTEEPTKMVLSLENKSGEGTDYPWIASADTAAGEWTELSGDYTVPENLDAIALNVETNGDEHKTKDFYADDLSIVLKEVSGEDTDPDAPGEDTNPDAPGEDTDPDEPGGDTDPDVPGEDTDPDVPAEPVEIPQELLYFNKSFEDGTEFVEVRGTASVNVTSETASEGASSLKVSQRGNQAWHGAALDLTSRIRSGGTYLYSVKVYTPEETEFKLSAEKVISGTQSWDEMAVVTIPAGQWTEISGSYTPGSEEISSLKWNFETTDSGIGKDFYLDEMKFGAADADSYVEAPEEKEPEVDKTLTPLQTVYQNDFLVGNLYNPSSLQGAEREMLLYHFNSITPENILKPDAMQPAEGNFGFAPADAMVEFADENDLAAVGHVFAWHQQTPDWMTSDCTRDEAIQRLRTHINTVAGRYAGKLISWDVVNEAIEDGAKLPENGDWKSCLRKGGWYDAIGDDYIELAFTFAHEADPNAKLYYNDYNLNDQNKAEIAAAMFKDLKSKGIPIDGIGMQAHYNVNLTTEMVERSIQMFEEVGAEISVTELDVTVNGADPAGLTEEQEIAQAQVYAELFRIYKEHASSIARVTFWGIDDAHSWRKESFPCLFNRDYSPKEAYYAVVDPDSYLEEHPRAEIPEPNQLTAAYGTAVVDGVVDEAWDAAESGSVNIMTMAWQGATAKVRALWDENAVYVLMDVTDSVLNADSVNAHEQDSVEVFIDENNAKTPYYEDDDGQFRVSYKNEVSYGSNGEKEGFESAVTLTDGGYLVEMKIPVGRTLRSGELLGFDAQVNDSNEKGQRVSIAKFNDSTDNSWQSTMYWGVLMTGTKAGEETPDPTPSETPDPTPSETPDPTPSETPDPTPSETPDPTPSETPDPAPSETPDPTPSETPDPAPSETPGETPDGPKDPAPSVKPTNTPKPTEVLQTTPHTQNTSKTENGTSPKTGDENQTAVYAALFAAALAGITVLTVKKRRSSR